MSHPGHPIVFIHGSGDSARIWRLQTDYFGSQRAVAIDLPGHGERPDTFDADVTVQQYAQAAYEIVTNELHLQAPIIAGHSLGGAVALTMALEYGQQLGGLLLVGTGARLRVHPTLLEDARQASSASPTTRSRISEMAFASSTPSQIADETLQEQKTPAPNTLYRDLAACNVFDVMSRLSEIHVPTLIICGEDDKLTPVKYSQYMHQHITGSDLHIIPDAGHYVMREQPQAFNQMAAQWLYEKLLK